MWRSLRIVSVATLLATATMLTFAIQSLPLGAQSVQGAPARRSAAPLRVKASTKTAATPKEPIKAKPISFNNEIEPLLTRAGCNTGSCHGAQYGKGGFK